MLRWSLIAMHSKLPLLWIGLLFANLVQAECHLETQTWDSLPHLMVRPSADGLQIKPKGFKPSEAVLWDVAHETGQSITLDQPTRLSAGNYHWLQLMGEQRECYITLATTYYDAKKDNSPRTLLTLNKTNLIITPVDLPKEHQQFRGTETWWFEVKQDGQPMINQTVYYWDSVGNQASLTSNNHGRFLLTFPTYTTEADNTHAGHNKRDSRQFAVWIASNTQSQISGFEYRYTPNPDNQHNLVWGTILAVIGMISAILLLVRMKKPKKRRAMTEESE